MGDITVLYAVGCALLCTLLFRWMGDPLRRIPTVGPSAPLLSYIGAFRFFNHAREVLQEGYDKYKVFKVAMLDRWIVVVSGAEMNEELRRVPDEQMSFMEAADELVQTRYTIAPDVLEHPIHIIAIKERLTKNLGPLFPEVVDEVQTAFQELLPGKPGEWVSVMAYPMMSQVISRASNRVFVGLPLCRNKEYLKLACEFSNEVMKGCVAMNVVPIPLKPFVGRLLPWSRRAIRKMYPYVEPLYRERQKCLATYGDNWAEKPNDLLMWTMEEGNRAGFKDPVDLIVQGVLASNFTAIHTSTVTFTHALYHLAANPEYIQPLREEIEAVIREDGWTKTSMGRMWKLDSFLKESQRMNGVGCLSVMRKALQDVTLSDGTFIPAGTIVSAASTSTHYDGEYYENPDVFSPFRFSDRRTEESERNKHHYVSTSPDYIGFGHGKHACPGRFFAANELKVMLACVVLQYDVQFEDGKKRPENVWVATNTYPAPDAHVLFRKRHVVPAV
ncbi:cytochrome P450 [Wolfiporia cocos MD-104 SS10]|uniref:Cytochrome P450 n=1 Tax=Wolfiporia cocos (strain MD-104) TaxID=742152 RepID=A0A2H3J3B6_WOLCO|nr:cytochrome P450 [Wolfiporia cocos MD-104 SS10]